MYGRERKREGGGGERKKERERERESGGGERRGCRGRERGEGEREGERVGLSQRLLSLVHAS